MAKIANRGMNDINKPCTGAIPCLDSRQGPVTVLLPDEDPRSIDLALELARAINGLIEALSASPSQVTISNCQIQGSGAGPAISVATKGERRHTCRESS